MSISKLESLPNEILTEILEKYINGIDIIKAFAFQLNRRFDALIAQCRRLRFDFMRCHQDDFRLCIGLLPAYINRIEELALSEQNTPGQIHAFLSFYPSFSVFKQLRRLYFHVNVESVESVLVEDALSSIVITALHTLTIKIEKTQKLSFLDITIVEIFGMKTLKNLSIDCEHYAIEWEPLTKVSSNIEYLTIHGIYVESNDLEHIFRCVSGLKYINIDLHVNRIFNNYRSSKSSSEDSVTGMFKLHTAIFNIESDQTVHDQLEVYLRCMPSLHRLEIKIHGKLDDISVWERLLQRSLPSLTYFTLECTTFSSEAMNMYNQLVSTQTPFWIGKQNFHIIVKECVPLNSNVLYSEALKHSRRYRSNVPVSRCWITPLRKRDDNMSVLNEISHLHLSINCNFLIENRYLDNVTYLIIDELDDDLFEMFTTHVNCSRIRHLDVSYMKGENKISSFLPYIRNVTSLRIKLNQVFDEQFSYLREFTNVKFLDMSADEHDFDEKTISFIANIFPHLDHLIICTNYLENIPMLKTYLPCLRSLTFSSRILNLYLHDDYEKQMLDHTLREKTELLFQCAGDGLTVWIDQAALQDFDWKLDHFIDVP